MSTKSFVSLTKTLINFKQNQPGLHGKSTM